ncbi:carbohydrate kinase family protein [Anoxybacter fermentans]|nr:sugar kinase [Anoxybacter fermentans]
MREKDRIDLLTIGETVMDFITTAMVDSVDKSITYQRYVGGSPANIAINVSRLGFSSALISRIGNDAFGDLIQRVLKEKKVNTTGIQRDEKHKTTIIFVTRSTSTPEVLHYRGADKYLEFTDSARSLIDSARIVHFSGFALSQSPCRESLKVMKEYALKKGKIITFDPCFHEPLWDNPKEGRRIFEEFISDFFIIKPSLDDMTRLWGSITPEEGIKRYHHLGAKNVVLTMGAEGLLFSDGKKLVKLESRPVEVLDVTGAGDSFWSGLYGGLLLEKSLMEAVNIGLKTASITVQHMGAIAPLPPIYELINE